MNKLNYWLFVVCCNWALVSFLCCRSQAMVEIRFSQACMDEPTVEFPTVLFHLPCYEGPCPDEFASSFRVFNVPRNSKIRFWTFSENGHELSFEPIVNDRIVYSVTEQNPFTHIHLIETKEDFFGRDFLEIPFSGSNFEICAEALYQVSAASLEPPEAEPIQMRRINGGSRCYNFCDFPDYFATGAVYYSDGLTKAYGSVVEAITLNGLPIRERTVYTEQSSRNYFLNFYCDTLEASDVCEVRACLPMGECEVCTDPVTIHRENPNWPDRLGDPVHQDFILPLPPPIQNERSDINRDNKVDADDLLLLLEDWGKVSGG